MILFCTRTLRKMIGVLLNRRGDAYAWTAALMLLVGIPLASLSIDIVRMMYVRGHLHTATDASCQAAVDALDVPRFINTGEAIINGGLGRAQAADVFRSTLTDATRNLFYSKSGSFSDMAQRVVSFIPQGRPGEAHEIADAVAFLASDAAAYINGHNIIVDGGWTCGFNRDF